MSPEAQRIAIAGVCGHKWVLEPFYPDDPDGKKWYRVDHPRGTQSCGFTLANELPDYLSDLNAIHVAEKVLTNEQRRAYALKLVHVHPLQYDPCDCGDDTRMKLFLIAAMTAAQRAEAFLRTLNLWDNSK